MSSWCSALPPPIPFDGSPSPAPNAQTPHGAQQPYGAHQPYTTQQPYGAQQQLAYGSLQPASGAPPSRSPAYGFRPPHSPAFSPNPAHGAPTYPPPTQTHRFPFPLLTTRSRDNAYTISTDGEGDTTRVLRGAAEAARIVWRGGCRVRVQDAPEVRAERWARPGADGRSRTVHHRGTTYTCAAVVGGYDVMDGSTLVATWRTEAEDVVLSMHAGAENLPGLVDTCVAAMLLLESMRIFMGSPFGSSRESKDGKESNESKVNKLTNAAAKEVGKSAGEHIAEAIVTAFFGGS